MVNKIMKVYLPSISMAFTMIILMSGISNWLVEKELNDFVSFSFGLFGFLIIIHILIELIGRINFKTYRSYFITKTILLYPITMFLGIRFKWFGFSVTNLIVCTFIYLCVMAGIQRYFYRLEMINVDEINSLLQNRKTRNRMSL